MPQTYDEYITMCNKDMNFLLFSTRKKENFCNKKKSSMNFRRLKLLMRHITYRG